MSTLADLVEKLPAAKKSRLVERFFRIWSSNGFGTMTEKDTELLLFRCLADLLGEHTPESNYPWAQLLRSQKERQGGAIAPAAPAGSDRRGILP